MYKWFCCPKRRTSKVEVDEITDSLTKCLSSEHGIREFTSFLEKNQLQESKTLSFILKGNKILTDIARTSPSSNRLPTELEMEIHNFYNMTEDINFDLNQMNKLHGLSNADIPEKKEIINTAVNDAKVLLEDIYKTFRAEILKRD